jgi:hypothetical protein
MRSNHEIIPCTAGEGDRAKRGGGGAHGPATTYSKGTVKVECACPLHHAAHGPPCI